MCWWMHVGVSAAVCKGMLCKKIAISRVMWPPTKKKKHSQVFRKPSAPPTVGQGPDRKDDWAI